MLSRALSSPILYLTLERTTNTSFPQGMQGSAIHPDLLLAADSALFIVGVEEKRNLTFCRVETVVELFPGGETAGKD